MSRHPQAMEWKGMLRFAQVLGQARAERMRKIASRLPFKIASRGIEARPRRRWIVRVVAMILDKQVHAGPEPAGMDEAS